MRCEFDAHYVSDEDAQRIRVYIVYTSCIHCVYIDQLQAENAELQDENARLRSCLSDDAENARMIMGENVKLRELVHDMFLSATFWFDHFSSERRYRDRMRELGIEVER